MRLILSHYLRTLRERDEFDRLLPELLVAMGYVPLSKPQAGIRQYGVDFAATGISPEDGVRELLLFVIKQGDIGRREWSASEPADIRPSINEVLDVFLTTHLPPEHSTLRKVVVLATTGEFKQELSLNWAGFVTANRDKACFQLWHGEKVASLLDEYMLNENLFAAQDRHDLRKALALSGDRDYAFGDFLSLLLRQLGLGRDGAVEGKSCTRAQLLKAIKRVNLATQVCAQWAVSEGDSKNALWICERALLWTWHRIQLSDSKDRMALLEGLSDLYFGYMRISHQYFETMFQHFSIRDGMSGYSRESAAYSLVLFEHIGIIATIGLFQFFLSATNQEDSGIANENAFSISDALCNLIKNHSAVGSPRLDRHVTEISLALILLVATNRDEQAAAWLNELARRLNFSFLRKRMFPICTDSLDDLVNMEVSADDATIDRLMRTSWMIPTIASWCALRGEIDSYALLANGSVTEYANVCGQLWHPSHDWSHRWYFKAIQFDNGDTEAPYPLPMDAADLLKRIGDFIKIKQYNWMEQSPARSAGLWALDFIACRHFHMPVPASFWYLIGLKNDNFTKLSDNKN